MSRTWDVAIVGAGYVGLPLAQTFADAGKRVLILDVVPKKTQTTPAPVIAACPRRLAEYLATEGGR